MTTALFLALSLLAISAPPPPASTDTEPLPPGAPTDPYELTAWCYGALGEYLTVYDTVKPDLRDIDRMFGTPVVEDEPYQSDMAAARQELKMIGEAVAAAEKASPRPISPVGRAAMHQGAGIWSMAETKTHRELARTWLNWALPDRCDVVARQLGSRSNLLGKALTYNNSPAKPPAEAAPVETPSPADVATPKPQPPAQEAPPAAVVETPTPTAEPVTQATAPASEPPPAPQPTSPPQQTTTAPSDQSTEPTL